jgi:hypothetical protein
VAQLSFRMLRRPEDLPGEIEPLRAMVLALLAENDLLKAAILSQRGSSLWNSAIWNRPPSRPRRR